jgi:hypothetical protein
MAIFLLANVHLSFFSATVHNILQSYSHIFFLLKGIVSRGFEVCFLVSFDRSDISKHQEWVLLLLKVRFCVEFFDFCAWA